jgi:hypothetical protein
VFLSLDGAQHFESLPVPSDMTVDACCFDPAGKLVLVGTQGSASGTISGVVLRQLSRSS